jgi:hypothetical protein
MTPALQELVRILARAAVREQMTRPPSAVHNPPRTDSPIPPVRQVPQSVR